MTELKSRTSENVYNPLDTHWNPAIDVEVVHELLMSIDPAVWDPDAVGDPTTVTIPAELPALMGMPRSHEVPYREIARQDITVDQLDTNDRFGPNTYRASGSGPVVTETMFMIHDSFGNGLEPDLAQYFARSTFLHWRNVVNAPAHGGNRMSLQVQAADIVIIESVERLLYRRFGGQLEDYPSALAAALVDDLSPTPVSFTELADIDPLETGRRYLVIEFAGGAGERIDATVDGIRDDRWIPRDGRSTVAWDVTESTDLRLLSETPEITGISLVVVNH